METTDKDRKDPQNDWQNAERNASDAQDNGIRSAQANGYGTEDEEDADTEEETAEEAEERNSDWGHVDPAEGNGPFPDPNAPSAPGSAV